MRSWIFAALMFLSLNSWGEDYLLRRLVVFPVDANESLASAADQAWWRMREELTKNKRFLLASKQFLVRKDAFQPRSDLSTGDAVLLGKLLDAHGIITTSIRQKAITLNVYSGVSGVLLWTGTNNLHPSVPINQQVEQGCLDLTRDFIASLPYQGFQIVDPLIGSTVFEEAGKAYAKIDLGAQAKIEPGETVQWIELAGNAPIFQEGGQVTVFAEGEVAKVDGEIATVEIKRSTDMKLLKERSLVRIPSEAKRIEEAFAIKHLGKKRTPEYLLAQLAPSNPESAETRPLLAALSGLASLAGLILLAF